MKKLLVVCLALLMVFTLSVPRIQADAALVGVNVSIELNTGIESIGVCLGTTYNAANARIYTASGTYPGLEGRTLSWKATAKPGYILDTESGTLTPSSLGINTIAPTASKQSFTLTVVILNGMDNIKITYGSNSKTFTSTGAVDVEYGTSVSWTATPKVGYKAASSSTGSFTMTSANTIAPAVTVKSFTVTASWTPAEEDPDLTWTLEWASGKALTGAVTDYVTMTVSADKKSVTLTFKKAFTNGQMILTCYATNNPSVKATCTVTCS